MLATVHKGWGELVLVLVLALGREPVNTNAT